LPLYLGISKNILKTQQLTAANQSSHLERLQWLTDNFSKHSNGFIFFTDKKLFTVAQLMNSK